jgi:hypothetical protein
MAAWKWRCGTLRISSGSTGDRCEVTGMGKTRAEVKLLRQIGAIGGKWAVHYGDGRVVTEAAIKVGDNYYYGVTSRSNKDTFNRKIGRVVALGKAWKKFEEGDPDHISTIPDELRQKEDRKHTPVAHNDDKYEHGPKEDTWQYMSAFCPACNGGYQARRDASGREVCPHCGHVVREK